MKRKGLYTACAILICCACMAVSFIAARPGETHIHREDDGVIDAVCSFGPVYAAAEYISRGSKNIRVTRLMQNQDMCLRSYTLKDWDVYALMGTADVFVIGGNGLESFEGIAAGLEDYGIGLIRLSDNAPFLYSESDDKDGHFNGIDPHIYLSEVGICTMLQNAAMAFCALDPENAAVYTANLEKGLQLTEDAFASLVPREGMKAGVMNEALLYTARETGAEAIVLERESLENTDRSVLDGYIALLREKDCGVVWIEAQAPEDVTAYMEENGFKVIRMDVLSSFDGDLEAMAAAAAGNATEAIEAN